MPQASSKHREAEGEPDRKSASAQPLNRAEKWIRKEAGAQRLASFPIFPRGSAGTPKGLGGSGRLLLLTFLGGARKV